MKKRKANSKDNSSKKSKEDLKKSKEEDRKIKEEEDNKIEEVSLSVTEKKKRYYLLTYHSP